MVDGKVEIAHEHEAAEGHRQVTHGDVRLRPVAGRCLSNHSDAQDVENDSEDSTGYDDGNNPRDHGRGGCIPDGGRAVAAL